MIKQRHYSYWGKARPEDAEAAQYHLLPYHALDVAAVGVAYLKRSPSLCEFLARTLPLESRQALLTWMGFWLALHDLGKFSEAFQGQRADLVECLRGRLPDPGKQYTVRHDSLGWMFWTQRLADVVAENEWFGENTEDLLDGIAWWMRASTGHHGQPPTLVGGGHWKQYFNAAEDAPAIEAFLEDLFVLFPLNELHIFSEALGAEAFEATSKALSWWMAGVTVLADWIGSNTDFFPYRADQVALADYWEEAQARAEHALDAAGVLPIPCRQQTFAELFPDIPTPSPLQAWSITACIPQVPQIHLLEDVTGAGKTEAAVMLAHRLIAAGRADGFFIALPTMATANAMYGRIAQVYRKLFEGHPSLVLAHGQRSLVEAFAESVIPAGMVEGDHAQIDETATARCNAWLADHNKRALLAPAGVGTIDQVLLSVLYSKHQSLRLLGMLRKALIVDEVHACDVYMQRVLETVLEFHARAGGSVVLLSATLPQQMKQSLLDAFARGRGDPAVPGLQSAEFPLVTSWHQGLPKPTEETLAARQAVCRNLDVRYVSDEEEILTAIRAALAAGRCVCWMRNTVADALTAHARFEQELDPDHLILFHARFALRDRLDTEQRILGHFGKSSSPAERAGRLVIATQVAEQSLDADWDFVVSDLAPIDRLIQRAGRLQRHPRDPAGGRMIDPTAADQRGRPCLWVFGPLWADAPAANWFKEFMPKAAGVYPHHGQLWLTAKALQACEISMPGDARTLIEGVFGEETSLPPGLQANGNQVEGDAYADLSVAMQNTIKAAEGYARDSIDWWSEAKTPSRLGEASMNVLLARWDGDRLRPWINHENSRHAWAYSTVKVAERLIAKRMQESDPRRERAVLDAMESLPGKGKWSVLLVLQSDGSGWRGAAWTAAQINGPPRMLTWRYDNFGGLQQVDTSENVEQELE
jgi:CRISPR-associated endonuclease/helicase Cas3